MVIESKFHDIRTLCYVYDVPVSLFYSRDEALASGGMAAMDQLVERQY